MARCRPLAPICSRPASRRASSPTSEMPRSSSRPKVCWHRRSWPGSSSACWRARPAGRVNSPLRRHATWVTRRLLDSRVSKVRVRLRIRVMPCTVSRPRRPLQPGRPSAVRRPLRRPALRTSLMQPMVSRPNPPLRPARASRAHRPRLPVHRLLRYRASRLRQPRPRHRRRQGRPVSRRHTWVGTPQLRRQPRQARLLPSSP